jgi:hypothetical protein
VPKLVRKEFCRFAIGETVDKGRYITKQNQTPFSLYFVMAGTVDLVRMDGAFR